MTDAVKGKGFQIIFKDRTAAGQILADVLKTSIKMKDHDEISVLGIPRGGVIIADAVARRLHANFDVIIPMKLRSPYKGNSIGAIMTDSLMLIDEAKIRLLRVSREHIENEKTEQLKEIGRRMSLYRSGSKEYKIKDKTVILVDDGIETGSTVIVAARWLKNQQVRRVIIAAPTANILAVEMLKKECDQIEIVTMPPNFVAISESYQNFGSVTDEQIVEILQKWQNQNPC